MSNYEQGARLLCWFGQYILGTYLSFVVPLDFWCQKLVPFYINNIKEIGIGI